MHTTTAIGNRTVRAEINYVRNAPGPGEPLLTFVTEDESLSTMQVLPGEMVTITDVRDEAPSLGREGFVLVPHLSSLSDLELIEEDPEVDRCYSEEMSALLQRVTGAHRVLMLGGGKKRYGESATAKLAPLRNAKPARYVHGDVTDRSGPMQAAGFCSMLGLDLSAFSRWALVNMWRPITMPPHDIPLAVCDARSIVDADTVPVVAMTEVRGFGRFDFETAGYLYNPSHRWCWFPDMTPSEVLVFMTHDSDPSRPHRVAHSAFTDPGCPPVATTRASVEMRGLVLFE